MKTNKYPICTRYEGNPILTGKDFPPEADIKNVFNSGIAKYKGIYIMVCRVENSALFDRFWVAESKDGYHFKPRPKPVDLPFDDPLFKEYAGSMIYHGKVERRADETVRLWLGEYRAVEVAVFVNGRLAGHIPWQAANGLDITRFLVPGSNDVDIEVVSSPRNMLGPLHLASGHELWTDWRSFRRTDATFTPEYVVQPWGLIGQVRLERE